MDRVALITGAGRGIGAELCRLLLEAGDTVVACPRSGGSEILAGLEAAHPGRLHVIPMDVADESSVLAAAREVGSVVDRIDLLFNNAGLYHKDEGTLGDLRPDKLGSAFAVNAVGPLLIVRSLLPLLRKGRDKRLAQLTSLMGSVEDNTSGGSYGYRMAKAALNMAVRNLAHELAPEGFLCFAIHPGWVQTRMGGGGAPLKLGPASAEVLRIALEATAAENGAFLGPGGKRLPY